MCLTGGEGFGVGSDPPGVQIPFGAMRLSPDTSLDNIVVAPNHFGGYHHCRCIDGAECNVCVQ